MKDVLITGGLGFIGSNLARKLISKDYRVWIVDDCSNTKLDIENFFGVPFRNVVSSLSKYYHIQDDPKNPRLVFIESDFTHPALLERVESGFFETVFHMAAKPRVEWSIQNPLVATTENFNKSIAMAMSCATGNTRIVFSSTSAVYGNGVELPTTEDSKKEPSSPYGMSKLCTEQYLKMFQDLYNLDWVALRYSNVYGPGQDGSSPYSTAVSAWCTKALNGKPLRKDGDGSQTRDLIHVDDVVSANICVAQKNKITKKIFNVGVGKSFTNNYILKRFAEKGYLDVKHAPARKGDVKHTLLDVSSLKELGWAPKVEFEVGLENVLNFWGL